MKIVQDEDLSPLLAYTQELAKKLSDDSFQDIGNKIQHLINHDEKVKQLNYPGLMTFMTTISTRFLVGFFVNTCDLGRMFHDAEHSSRDLFEEIIKSLRILAGMPEIPKDHPFGIKKIQIKE